MEEPASSACYLLESVFDPEDGNNVFLRNINRILAVFIERKVELFVAMTVRKLDRNCCP
jgi:hypothetical protein